MEKIRFYSTLLNLQRFADPEPTPAPEPTPNPEPNPEPKDKPFKAFKTENEFNSWFDSAYDKRFEKAAENLKAKWEKESKEKKSYEQMTDAEKAEYDFNQKQEKLNQREQEVTVKENHANITNKLAEDGLPVSLAKAFTPAFADTDNLEATYKEVTEGFREALKQGVDKALSDSSKIPGAGGGGSKSTGESMAEERNKQSKGAAKSIWDTVK
ncbi:capsid assembly scaffolding protein Gp46 family protein [Lactiplantibacillus plantarum]|uniref:capsid assembly scaffolding protein Gp46 family protein n=1 Tax=Lactiplantibacillus plantarum TaxID=1590 RepID=UPI00070B6CE5|nr:DUF4355 domain-containing protein [Lactiplantibacillus plantarum]